MFQKYLESDLHILALLYVAWSDVINCDLLTFTNMFGLSRASVLCFIFTHRACQRLCQ